MGDANWETTHVTFDHGGKVPYIEGQSIGIIAPGPDKKGQTWAKIRLYSIASSAVGDDQTSNTVSLCVKRVVELDGKFANREVGEDKPDKAGTHFPKNKVYRGVASNYICDLNIGDEVSIYGPVGTEMLLPDDPNAVIIMLATGTGIAPMRSYLRYLFVDKAGANRDGSRKFKGLAWLFLGVPYSKSLLYDDENVEYKKNSQISTATNTQSPVSRQMLRDKRCTSKQRLLSTQRRSGTCCNTKRRTSTCAV